MTDRASLYKDPGLFGSSLLLLFIDDFGMDALDWESESITTTIAEKYGVVMPAENFDRLSAAAGLITSDQFFLSPEAFSAVCRALSFRVVDGRAFLPPSTEDMIWGVTEARIIRGSEDFSQEAFSYSVRALAGLALSSDGFISKPSQLQFAVMPLEEQTNAELTFMQEPALEQALLQRQQADILGIQRQTLDRLSQLLAEFQTLPIQSSPDFIPLVKQLMTETTAKLKEMI